jgi:hypothetical protein
VLFAPALAADGKWHEIDTGILEQEHTLDDVVRALGTQPAMVNSE